MYDVLLNTVIPCLHLVIFARTLSDADASTHKKGARRHVDASDEANADRSGSSER